MKKHIAILDFGSQYMHLISRRVRQLGVLAKIYPTDINASELEGKVYGVIISGGPNSVNEQKLPYDPGLFDLDVPVLGLCYGHQLMAYHYGGEVREGFESEYGFANLLVDDKSSLFAGLENEEQVWMSHWDSVSQVPDGFTVLGHTKDAQVSAMANDELQRYSAQFHMEVHHTENGMQMLKNFVFEICEAEVNWSMEEYLEELEQQIRDHVGDRKVFLLVSGGVDSSVAYALLEKILGKDRVYGLHIDNGFMRLDESARVKEMLASAGFGNLHVIDASDHFIGELEGKVDPEEKRHIVGRVFLEAQRGVFDALEFKTEEWLLGQGTIYPDTIESGGTDASHTIKTHHNRVDEIVEMINAGRIVEPLAELYKDEVRALGANLGLPDELLNRWPFPGPGLSIRILCSDGNTPSIEGEEDINAQLAKIADGSTVDAHVAPLRSVGVQGDQRSYAHPAVLHGTGSADLDWEKAQELSMAMTNGVKGVNRVVLHVGGDLDAQNMQVPEAYATRERGDMLRAADDAVTKIVRAHNLYDSIWQFPVILIPLNSGAGEGVVLRPIESQEAMTVNFYHLDKAVLKEMAESILQIDGISNVFFDITNKPPGTIEWE